MPKTKTDTTTTATAKPTPAPPPKKKTRWPLKAGIHVGISLGDYNADPAPEPSFSWEQAHAILRASARHAWTSHPRLNPDYTPDEDTSQAATLTAAVKAILFGSENDMLLIDAPHYH